MAKINKRVIMIMLCILHVLNLFSQEMENNYNDAVSSYNNNDFVNAKDKLLAVLREDPQNESAYFILSLCYKELNDFPNALKCINKSISIDPLFSESYLVRAQIYGLAGKEKKMIQDYEKSIALGCQNCDAYNITGFHYYEIGNYDKAINFYKKAIKICPDSLNYIYNLCICYSRSGSFDSIVNITTKYISKYPNYMDFYFLRGTAFMNNSKPDSGILDLKKYVTNCSHSALALYNIAYYYCDKQLYDSAVTYIDSAIYLSPENADYLTLKGEIKLYQKNYDVSLEYLYKSLLFDKKYTRTYYLISKNYYETNNMSGALKYINIVISCEPCYGNSYLLRGDIYTNIGKMEKACDDFNKAKSMGIVEAESRIQRTCNRL